MPNWSGMSDKELTEFCNDQTAVEAETMSEREKLQVELCKRFRMKWIKTDGTVGYEPPDWRKEDG